MLKLILQLEIKAVIPVLDIAGVGQGHGPITLELQVTEQYAANADAGSLQIEFLLLGRQRISDPEQGKVEKDIGADLVIRAQTEAGRQIRGRQLGHAVKSAVPGYLALPIAADTFHAACSVL